jgi:hypothetical protein
MDLTMSRWLCSLALVAACSSEVRNDAPEIGETEGTSGQPPATTSGTASDETEAPPDERLDVPPSAESSTGIGDEECTSFTDTGTVTRRPADIIWVVDNSPSMIQETDAVQARLNAFSEQIVGAGIDIRVLLLTAYPDPQASPEIDTGVCIDPPLGGGGCPQEDDNQPIFAHVQSVIGSEHALDKILDTYSIWEPMMRDGSLKHIIVVTDDDSFVPAGDFDAQFLGLDPGHAGYQFHGIVATQPCGEGAVGSEYIALAEMTGGVIGNLCEQEFQPLFDLLSTAVEEGTNLACAWAMPEAPEGRVIDPDSVEVSLTIDGAVVVPARVGGAESCVAGQHGWYFDDPEEPTQIVSCPTTCDALSTAVAADLEIDVGCATVVAG